MESPPASFFQTYLKVEPSLVPLVSMAENLPGQAKGCGETKFTLGNWVESGTKVFTLPTQPFRLSFISRA